MALTSRLEVEIDSRDAEQKAKALRDSLVQLEESGKLVNPALKKAGDSMSGLSDSSEKARKSVSGQSDELEALLGKLDPLRKKQTELAKSQAQLAAAFKNGDLNEASYKKFSGVIRDQVTAINSSRAALTGLNADLGKTGNSAKQNAAALRMLPAQFSDIAVSLQGGQAPLTVFLQQGSQIKDSFGGAGAAVKAFSGYLASMVNPVTVGAAAVVALGAIVVSSQGQFNEFQKALVSSGNAAGTTADQLILLSNSIAGGRNFTEASEAVLALATNGRLSGEALEAVARASTELSVATGKGAGDIADELSNTKANVTALAVEYSDKYGVITKDTFELIRALEQQGDKIGAIKVLSGAVADEMGRRNKEMVESTRGLAKAWDEVKTSVSGVYNQIKTGLSASPELFKLQHLQGQLADAQEIGDKALIKGLEEQVALAQTAVNIQSKKNEGVANEVLDRKTIISADSKWNSDGEKYLSARVKMDKEIAEAKRIGLEAGKSQLEIDKRIGEIQAEYKKKEPKEKAYTEDAGTKALDQAKQQYAVLVQQSALIDEQGAGTKALGAAAKDLIEWEQQLSDIKSKKTLTADQKSLLAHQDQITAVKTQSAEQEKLNALKKEELDTSAKLLAFQENLTNQLNLSREGLSNELAGIGMGQKGRERLREDLKIRQDYQKQLTKLTYDYNKIVNPTSADTELYDRETQSIKDALDIRLGDQEQFYKDLDRAQADWSNGANDAWHDYVDEAGNIAGQTYDLFDNAFRGMEDSLVDFVTGGKLSFKDLADSIIADIARIIIKTQVVTPLLNSLFGGGAGAGGGLSSILGGGSGGGMNAQGMFETASKAYSVATSAFGDAVSAGWTAGEGFLGGVQGAFKAGSGYLSSSIGSLFGSAAGSSGAMVNGVYQLGSSGGVATVDLISNTVTNSSGAVTGSASAATTTAASAGLSATSAVMYGIGGAIQGYLKAGVKGAVAGAGGAVAGAYAGAAIGSAVPIIGTAIGAAIGAVLGGMFGSSLFGGDWVTKDQGFQLGVNDGELNSYNFEYQKKKGGLFSSNKKRTRLSALDPDMQAALDNTYASTLGTVIGLFDSLNVELSDGVLDGLNVSATKISTKGKTAEAIQVELAKWFGGLADAAASEINKVTDTGFGKELNFEYLTTFVNNLYSVAGSLEMIGAKTVDFNIIGGRAVEHLVALAGGIENLNKNITTFYDGFTTDLQKSASTLDGVRAQFAAMQVVLPETRQGFADVVKGLDTATEAGRILFGSLTANSEQAAAMYTILEARESAYRSAFFSEAENTALAIKGTTAELKALGVTLPASRSEYRKMVEEAAKSTTDTGKAMYDTLMNAAAAASTVFDELERRLNQGVTDSFSGVQRSITAQQKAATAAYNATNASLSDMSETAAQTVNDLSSVSGSLESALKSLRGTSDDAVKTLRAQAQATLQSALATARAGGSLSGFTGLSDALDTVGNNSTDLYSSMEDFARDQGRTAGVVAELEAINGKQLTSAELTVKALEDQLDTSKEAYELQMAQFDQDLAFAQAQMDAFNGIDTSVKSVEAAIKALNGSLIASLAAKPATGAGSAVENTAANNATVVDTLYQQLFGRTADAGENKYWADRLSSGNLPYAEIVANMTQYASAADKAAMAVKGHATGGYISGPGTGTSDSIMARLSNGEYVMTADSVRMFGTGLLDQMNAGNLPAFAGGGGIRLVGSSTAESSRPASARYGSGAAAAAMSGSGSQQGVIEAILSLGNYLYMITKYSEQTASGIRRQNEMEEAA